MGRATRALRREPGPGPGPATRPPAAPVPAARLSTAPVPAAQLSTAPVPAAQLSTAPVPAAQLSTAPVPAFTVIQTPLWLLAAAGLWSAGLIGASFWVRPSLIQVNGAKVLLPVSAPLAIVALVVLGLSLARRRSARWASIVSWVLAGLLDCLALVGMLTIGIFILPVAIAVTAACAMS